MGGWSHHIHNEGSACDLLVPGRGSLSMTEGSSKMLLVIDTEYCFLNQHNERQTSRQYGSQAGTECVMHYKKKNSAR
jgi:hypothetical protein